MRLEISPFEPRVQYYCHHPSYRRISLLVVLSCLIPSKGDRTLNAIVIVKIALLSLRLKVLEVLENVLEYR
jgi:hypothetical protein